MRRAERTDGVSGEFARMRNRALESVASFQLATLSSDLFDCSDLKLLVIQTDSAAISEEDSRIYVKSRPLPADQFFQRLTGKELLVGL
jgi:hypothetical protein